MRDKLMISILLAVLPHSRASAESPKEIIQRYEAKARETDKNFGGFSAARGRELYFHKERTTKGEISCSSCHTVDPKAIGRTRANKDIDPLAPVANPKRFTNFHRVEKWFDRNCDDVLRRPCTAREKGDFITFLLSIK